MKRNLYAITTGDYVGRMFFFAECSSEHFHFLSMPDMVNVAIPKDQWQIGVDNKIVDFVEKVPRNVSKILLAQFTHNKNKHT